MSQWRHNICNRCWERLCEQKGEVGRVPHRLLEASEERCCYCGVKNTEGIYVREDPKHPALLCCGMHEQKEQS